MKKYYLAHNFNDRYEIRNIELYIEKRYNIELLNPFFDQKRNDLVSSKEKNRHEIKRKFKKLTIKECENIVERDLKSIRKCDGLISIINNESIGTSMELIMCAYVYRMPIYVITTKCNHHPWIRYLVKNSNGKIFKHLSDFEEWLTKEGLKK